MWSQTGAMLYPETETLFYERTSSDPVSRQERIRALVKLTQRQQGDRPPIVVAPARALMQKIVEARQFTTATKCLVHGDVVDVNQMLLGWLGNGYRRELVVEDRGGFACRGGIVDIFPVTSSLPVRIELFGDEIDTIREFDPATQRSGERLESILIPPARETELRVPVILSRLAALDLSSLRPEALEQWRKDIEAIEESGISEELAFYASVCGEATLLDYLGQDALLILDDVSETRATVRDLDEQARNLRRELLEFGELPGNFPKPYCCWTEMENAFARKNRLEFAWREGFAELDGLVEPWGSVFQAVPTYGGRIKMVVDDIRKALRSNGRLVVATQQAQRLLELLNERGLPARLADSLETAPSRGSVVVVHEALHEGFQFAPGNGRPGITLLTDLEIFGWSKPRRVVQRKSVQRDAFLSDIEIGDLVVHVDHGIGRFRGLTRIADDGAEREYLAVEYAEGDRLYVPTDQLDRVNKYIGVGEHAPVIHRLGSGDWMRARERVKAAVREVARDLLEVYAAREAKPGFAFSPDSPWQRELEDSFPYVETADQMLAIAETKADMERPKPMDRLICGDVGYGKTEVALRAAFKAVTDGKQVAILVPTTVLAQQHYKTFQERLQTFPINVEMLSRFRTEKEQKAVLEGLRAGTVDICIGTHRLIQKDVQFRDLGLVIIDEEQRFGVVHKERLKQLRKEVDVLTLTATPIPRTLHMAISGVRDMSTMETPPEERLPIKTFVTEYDGRLVRDAILRELDRGGQVYFVHNRVQSIDYMAKRLEELVPEAIIAVGHGQMPEDHLEKVMVNFAAGKFDVLVCTTIIESGLDIPNVNTIIVNHADRFGLAQLYQLRGRVGRGANRAYAYFLFARDKRLTPTAEKRLRTIFEATELGAGFRIAMKDLEIRGAGNLLGTEQHGHVAAVGFDLYCRMLADAVRASQGKVEERLPEVTLILPLNAYLPADYVPDEPLRINLYQRLASATTLDQVGNLVLEMRDRFGSPPKPVLDLAYLVQLKIMAAHAGIRRIESSGEELVIALAEGKRLERERLSREFGQVLKVGNTQARLQMSGPRESWLEVLGKVVERLGELDHLQD